MSELSQQPGTGWIASPSILHELDIVLTALMGKVFLDEFHPLLEQVSMQRRTSWRVMLGEAQGIFSVLSTAARWAGAPASSDYAASSLQVRMLRLEDALQAAEAEAAPFSVASDSSLPLVEKIIDLGVRTTSTLLHQVGLEIAKAGGLVEAHRQNLELLVRILPEGDLQASFWRELDRLVYETYLPWRASRQAVMDETEERLTGILGGRENSTRPPEIDWLPAQNPILRLPELSQAVRTGQMPVFFWIEPFGLNDFWDLTPAGLLVSFAEAGAIFANFQTHTAAVADRARALGDPTRLIILRLIRHFSMTNTDIAAYLGLSRPTVSIHAKILREAGLIRSWQAGREVRHAIQPENVRALFHDIERFLELTDHGS